jgi:hypothetical protein
MTTYAIPPEGCERNLTSGKRYAVLTGDERHAFDIIVDDPARCFSVVNDEGHTCFCLWENCAYVLDGDWQREED